MFCPEKEPAYCQTHKPHTGLNELRTNIQISLLIRMVVCVNTVGVKWVNVSTEARHWLTVRD